MREVHLSDLVAAARVLLAVPARDRVCAQLLIEAHCADKFVKRLGRPHSEWGNGTLMAAARARLMTPERSFSDAEYTDCFMKSLRGLEQHRRAKACKSWLHAHIKNYVHHGFAFG